MHRAIDPDGHPSGAQTTYLCVDQQDIPRVGEAAPEHARFIGRTGGGWALHPQTEPQETPLGTNRGADVGNPCPFTTVDRAGRDGVHQIAGFQR
ncbi:MAG: hypothetical protein ACK56I_28945, partial [bacterium]